MNAFDEKGDTALAMLVDQDLIDAAYKLSTVHEPLSASAHGTVKKPENQLLLTLRERQIKTGKSRRKVLPQLPSSNSPAPAKVAKKSNKSKAAKRKTAKNKAKRQRQRRQRQRQKELKMPEAFKSTIAETSAAAAAAVLREQANKVTEKEESVSNDQKDQKDQKKRGSSENGTQQKTDIAENTGGGSDEELSNESKKTKELASGTVTKTPSRQTLDTGLRVDQKKSTAEDVWEPVMSRAEQAKLNKQKALSAAAQRRQEEQQRILERQQQQLARERALQAQREKEQKLCAERIKAKGGALMREALRKKKIADEAEQAAVRQKQLMEQQRLQKRKQAQREQKLLKKQQQRERKRELQKQKQAIKAHTDKGVITASTNEVRCASV